MDNKTKDALKQLQAEMRQLQALVAEGRRERKAEPAPPEESHPLRQGKSRCCRAVCRQSARRPATRMRPLRPGMVAVTAAQTGESDR